MFVKALQMFSITCAFSQIERDIAHDERNAGARHNGNTCKLFEIDICIIIDKPN